MQGKGTPGVGDPTRTLGGESWMGLRAALGPYTASFPSRILIPSPRKEMKKVAGRVSTGAKYRITKDQFQAIKLLSEGWTYDRIAMCIFDVTDGNGGLDTDKLRKARERLREWFKNPKINNAYKEYIVDMVMPSIPKSIQRLTAQVDSEKEWVANKAANDILREFKGVIFGEEDKTVHVQIEGMPEIGEPDD